MKPQSTRHSLLPLLAALATSLAAPANAQWPLFDFASQTTSTSGAFWGLGRIGEPSPYGPHLAHRALVARGNNYLSSGLTSALSTLTNLDYLLMDVEGDTLTNRTALLSSTVSTVRSHAKTAHRDAWIGNYDYFAGAWDWSDAGRYNTTFASREYAGRADWPRNSDYTNSGFDVSMPKCYFYSHNVRHRIWPYYWGTGGQGYQYSRLSPTDRAAIFYATLEKGSIAARNLPWGHKLIPWVGGHVQTEEVSPQPTRDDLSDIIQHLRMRKASSVVAWGYTGATPVTTNGGTLLYPDWLTLVRQAWDGLNSDFPASGRPVTYLHLGHDVNTTTVQSRNNINKVAGLNWSGVRNGNNIHIIGTNHSTSAKTAYLQLDCQAQAINTWFNGMPASLSVPVESGTNGPTTDFTATISNLIWDNALTTSPNYLPRQWFPWSTGAAYATSGGSGNSSCYNLTNGATLQGETKLRIEPREKMSVSLWAKRVSGASTVNVVFYVLDWQGNKITSGGNNVILKAWPTGSPISPSTTGQTYTAATLNIPATIGSPAKEPYFLQTLIQTTGSGEITVDNPVVKFSNTW